MPRTKNGKLCFTKEQYNFARYEASALEYAKAQGYELVQKGRYAYMKDHDSMVFGTNGQWFWNSMNMKGGALEFVMAYEGKSLVEAVLILNQERIEQAEEQLPHQQKADYSIKEDEASPREFELPPKAENFKKLYAYLGHIRGFSQSVINVLVKKNVLYQSAEQLKNNPERTVTNCIFVTNNEEGTPVAAFKRGCSQKSTFKMEVEGSRKDIPFALPVNGKPNILAVFEGAIDAVSHACIYELSERDPFGIHRIATGGSPKMEAIEWYLKQHPEIDTIWLAQDNDQGGQKQKESIRETFMQDMAIRELPPLQCCKDWNESLLMWRKVLEQSVQEQLHQRRKASAYRIHVIGEEGDTVRVIDCGNDAGKMMETIRRQKNVILETPAGYQAAIRSMSVERNHTKEYVKVKEPPQDQQAQHQLERE